jgi:hypothetical protein
MSAFTATILRDGVMILSQSVLFASATASGGQVLGTAPLYKQAALAKFAASSVPALGSAAKTGVGADNMSPLEMTPIKKTKTSPLLIHCLFFLKEFIIQFYCFGVSTVLVP